jgi:hypothetical protein
MHDLDRNELIERVRKIIKQYQGPDLCITKEKVFVEATGENIIPWRRVDQTRIIRSMVKQLRREGCPIAFKSGKRGGYFWARTDQELETTINVFHSRAMSSLKQEATLKRIPVGDVVDQYKLEIEEGENQ